MAIIEEHVLAARVFQVVAALALACPAVAEQLQIDEIIVTAQKREERALDVSASLDVFTGEALQAAGVSNVADLQFISPGIAFVPGAGDSGIGIRGISNNVYGPGADPSAATHLDGVYLPRSDMVLTELFDVSRVEVLKGPQGTLYGRNATAGALNVVSQLPGDSYSGYAYIGTGSFDLQRVQGAANLPFGDGNGVRLSANYSRDHGYTKNLVSPTDADALNYLGGRARLHLNLTDVAKLDFTLQAIHDRSTVGQGLSNNPALGADPIFGLIRVLDSQQRVNVRNIRSNYGPFADRRGTFAALNLTFDLGAVGMHSITGYIDWRDADSFDTDGTAVDIERQYIDLKSKTVSQEFQFYSLGEAHFSWTAGLYYAKERNTFHDLIDDSGIGFGLFRDDTSAVNDESYAAFARGLYHLTDTLSVTLGGRDTHQGKDAHVTSKLTGLASMGDTSANRFTPELLLDYQFGKDVHGYASISEGFKSGGINTRGSLTTYRPELVWAYEVGLKGAFSDRRITSRSALFYYDYRDIQLFSITYDQSTKTTIAQITNASRAKIYGVEYGIDARLSKALSFEFNAAYLRTQLLGYINPVTLQDLSGIHLAISPELSGTIAANYDSNLGSLGSLRLRAEFNYQGPMLLPNLITPSTERRSGVSLINASARFRPEVRPFYLELIGRNLTNRTYLINRIDVAYAGYSTVEFYAAPRTWEVRLGYEF